VRTVRIDELDITYPEGSSRAEGDWEDDDTEGYTESRWVWKWTSERRFLSRTSALARAKSLAAMGCTVDVRQSEPIAWEDAPAAHFEPLPPTPPAMECTPEGVPW